MIGTLVATCIIRGIKVAYREDFQTYAPLVPEPLLPDAFYGALPIYLNKMKNDLVGAGVWETRALQCILAYTYH